MTQSKWLLAAVLLFGAVASLAALGGKDKHGSKGDAQEPESQQVQVEASGRVRLVGNSPFSTLVITGEEKEWIVEAKEQAKLINLQQQTVTVEGTEYFKDLTFANGKPAGRQYYLKDIKIISP